jgi:amidohydrolase
LPIINRVAALQDEISAWRQDLHANPELGFELTRTARMVADLLRGFGCDDVVTGIGRSGVVGIIQGRQSGSGRVLGLRADMDALPIAEDTGVAYASKVSGCMHACGHDGHTAMLLGAAKYLCETRNFDGTAVLVFQPNEEGLTGAKAMLDDGVLKRFGVQEIYGLHISPMHDVGVFALRPGAMMAAADRFTITISGKGGHASRPHESKDPVLVAAHTVVALQSIASRVIDPLDAIVLSTCTINSGDAFNVIPQTANMSGTVRTLSESVRDQTEASLAGMVHASAAMFGTQAEVKYERLVPVTINDDQKARFAARVAKDIAAAGNVIDNLRPVMAAEDFSFMLEQRPGAYILIGNGTGPGLHHPGFNFNDKALPYGVSYLARLVETAMAA